MPRLSRHSKTLEIQEQDLSEAQVLFLLQYGSLAVDTETGGLDPWFCDLRLVTICTPDNHIFLIRNPTYESKNLVNLLQSIGIKFLFQNALFDLRFLVKHLGLLKVPDFECTKTLAKTIFWASRSGLRALLKNMLNIEINKQIDHTWNEQNLSSRQIEYACNDVLYLHPLFNYMKTQSLTKNTMAYSLAKENIQKHVQLTMLGQDYVLQFEDLDPKEIHKRITEIV